MLHRDWLMRQIEQAARLLGAIIAKVTTGQTTDVLGLFDQAYRPLLGIGATALPYLSDDQLLDMLRPGGAPDHHRWPVLAKLLAVEADFNERQGADHEAFARWRRAMLLLNELGGEPQREPVLAAEVAGRLRAYRLRPATRVQVACLYERAGRYADAEDTYFEGLDEERDQEAGAGPGEPGGTGGQPGGGAGTPAAAATRPNGEELLVDEAIAFYRRLLKRDDAALEAGGLPRDEVLASLGELLARPVTAEAPGEDPAPEDPAGDGAVTLRPDPEP